MPEHDLNPSCHKAMIEIERALEQNGVAPSIRQLASSIGKGRSVGYVHKLLLGLERRGFIRRLANRNRAIEVLIPVSRFEVMRFCGDMKLIVPLNHTDIAVSKKQSPDILSGLC